MPGSVFISLLSMLLLLLLLLLSFSPLEKTLNPLVLAGWSSFRRLLLFGRLSFPLRVSVAVLVVVFGCLFLLMARFDTLLEEGDLVFKEKIYLLILRFFLLCESVMRPLPSRRNANVRGALFSFVCLSVRLSVRLSVCLSVCRSSTLGSWKVKAVAVVGGDASAIVRPSSTTTTTTSETSDIDDMVASFVAVACPEWPCARLLRLIQGPPVSFNPPTTRCHSFPNRRPGVAQRPFRVDVVSKRSWWIITSTNRPTGPRDVAGDRLLRPPPIAEVDPGPIASTLRRKSRLRTSRVTERHKEVAERRAAKKKEKKNESSERLLRVPH